MLRKAWLAFSASAMLGAAAIASNAALAQPFPAPSPAAVLLVPLVLAVLLVLGPPTFLVLPASEAVVLASAAVPLRELCVRQHRHYAYGCGSRRHRYWTPYGV
jgi:hypothetical protein